MPDDFRGCCGPNNRGFAAHGDKLFLGTGDAHLVALDMKTGDVVWDVELAEYKKGYSATVAPIVVKDKVIIGIAGAEFGIRGFIDAYDVNTGKRAWRFHTVAGPGEPGGQTWPKGSDAYLRGGGSIWVIGHLRSRTEPRVLRDWQSWARLLQPRARRRQSVHVLGGCARCRHRAIEVAFPVHAARCARLGLDAGAGPRRPHDQRHSRARRCCSPIATGSSTCSIARTAA